MFLNDQLVTKLDLSHNQEVGLSSVMGDFYYNHQRKSEFKDFNVWAP